MRFVAICPYCEATRLVNAPYGITTSRTRAHHELVRCSSAACDSRFRVTFAVKKVRAGAPLQRARRELLARQDAERAALRAEPGCDCDAKEFHDGRFHHREYCARPAVRAALVRLGAALKAVP